MEQPSSQEAKCEPCPHEVLFHSVVKVREISRISEYDMDEIIAVWGTRSEQDQRHDELQREMKEYLQGHRNSDNLTFTTVGIKDRLVRDRKEEKFDTREEAWHAVLWEQHYQEEEARYDDKSLAEVYTPASQKAQQKAVEEARQLEQQVNIINGANNNSNSNKRKKKKKKSQKTPHEAVEETKIVEQQVDVGDEKKKKKNRKKTKSQKTLQWAVEEPNHKNMNGETKPTIVQNDILGRNSIKKFYQMALSRKPNNESV